MSSVKFAAITASLLARKGDAAPSVVVPVTAPPRPVLVPRDHQPFRPEPRQPDDAEKLRRIVISITRQELERLDIAAIKKGANRHEIVHSALNDKGANRHEIVRSALNDYFRKLSAEFPHCACIEGSPAVPAPHAESEVRAAQPSYPVHAEGLESAILAMETAENRL